MAEPGHSPPPEFRGTDRFRLDKRLGAGGMGIVYAAFDRQRQTRVALKTLRRLEAQALYRFKNEFRALQGLSHPNLVRLGELFEEQGQWFFTMELVEGVDLLTYVGRSHAIRADASSSITEWSRTVPNGPEAGWSVERADVATGPNSPVEPMPPADLEPVPDPGFDEAKLRAAFGQLVAGLVELHAAGKVHRDIKPSNILVTAEGRVVLLDFGLITDARSEDSGEPLSDLVVGTVDYMAPEQATPGAIGPAADWYSVGVVLHEALTGRMPFSGAPMQVLIDKQRRPPPAPRKIAAAVPADLDALCQALLSTHPEQRPRGEALLEAFGVSQPTAPRDAARRARSTRSLWVGPTSKVSSRRRGAR